MEINQTQQKYKNLIVLKVPFDERENIAGMTAIIKEKHGCKVR